MTSESRTPRRWASFFTLRRSGAATRSEIAFLRVPSMSGVLLVVAPRAERKREVIHNTKCRDRHFSLSTWFLPHASSIKGSMCNDVTSSELRFDRDVERSLGQAPVGE